jgi:hypothetical protein
VSSGLWASFAAAADNPFPIPFEVTHAQMKLKILILSVCILTFASVSQGAIVWSNPVNISDSSAVFAGSVANNGTFVAAYNFGSPSTVTINGVTFSPLGTSNPEDGNHRPYYNGVGGKFSVSPYPGFSSGTMTQIYNPSGGGIGPVTQLTNVDHRTLIRSFITASGSIGGSVQGYTMQLQGLTPGYQYQVQIWASDSRELAAGGNWNDRRGWLSDGTDVGSMVLVDQNVTNEVGGLGQYVIGRFTAESSTQSFDYFGANGTGYIPLNAYSLRLLDIPEPSSALLAAAGLFAGLSRRRR